MKLKLTTSDGELFLIDFGSDVDVREMIRAGHHHGGFFVGADKKTFLPWGRVALVEIIE